MAEMSSTSESEIHTVMEEQASKRQEDQRKFLDYHSNTQGDMEWQLQILSDLNPSTRSNLAADDCASVALEHIEPDG